jgi:hypothetical protein
MPEIAAFAYLAVIAAAEDEARLTFSPVRDDR